MSSTGSQKSERLINLTMALLASSRFLSKSEIFEIVAGYAGSAETKERMFERDKNDLRELGLDIEVGTEDPLFDDEAGYRIKPSSYAFQPEEIGALDPLDISLLSLAAAHWQNSLFSRSGQSALRKLESILPLLEGESLSLPLMSQEIPESRFESIWYAIKDGRVLSFTYRAGKDSRRRVEPLRMTLSEGFWYVIAFDLDVKEVRRFKLIRIGDDLKVEDSSRKAREFHGTATGAITADVNPADEIDAVILLRVGRAHELRHICNIVEEDSDWDRATARFDSEEDLFEKLAAAGSSALLIYPQESRLKFIAWIGEKINV